MTIAEVIEKKETLEQEIDVLVKRFNDDTGVLVDDVLMRRHTEETLGGAKYTYYTVTVEVRL